jgi:hypothetical protein
MVKNSFNIGCIVLLSCALSACFGRPVASYNWQFRQMSAEAKDKDKTLASCETAAKRANSQIRNDNMRIWSYVDSLQFCMRQQGWESLGRPVTITYI